MTESHNSKVIEQLEAMRVRGEINEKVRDHLMVHKPRTSQLYLLPKIHKNVSPVPGRPIVSANDSPTERISTFVDHFLAPIVHTSKSYIQDTSDFLRKLGDFKDIPSKASLVTLDICSLYINIPNKKYVYTYRLKPLAWYRYIDDVFCIWQHGDSKLKNFVEHLNNTHDTIKFLMET